MRQICDWCRLLWTYRKKLDKKLLERRLRDSGIISEWKAFANLAVDYIGMPVEAMPLYDTRYKEKGNKVLSFVFDAGNFGHNRDYSYQRKAFFLRKMISLWLHVKDSVKCTFMFPVNSFKVLIRRIIVGIVFAWKGIGDR